MSHSPKAEYLAGNVIKWLGGLVVRASDYHIQLFIIVFIYRIQQYNNVSHKKQLYNWRAAREALLLTDWPPK